MTRPPRLALLVAAAALLGMAASDLGRSSSGWTLQLLYSQDVDSLDPALGLLPGSQALLWLTCETLTRYPDAPAPVGAQPVPGGAGPPRISADRRSYTFTVRKDLRFSDGSPVTAANYAAAINRVLDPQMQSLAATLYLTDVVGAQAVMNGKATAASGVQAHGQVLTIRLLRPAPDILSRLALTPFCPIPIDLPHDPAGVDTISSTGPYAVQSRVVDQKIVLVRNPYYRGSRPHYPSRIVVTVGGTDEANVAAVARGAADYATDLGGLGGAALSPTTLAALVQRYGVNRGRFFFEPTLDVNFFALNTAHGIFAGNPSLRRAVNYAVDRHALAATFGYLGVKRTAQLLPLGVPGYIRDNTYPVSGPDLARARALARGHLRNGQALMYAPDVPRYHLRAYILQYDLAKIGIHLDVRYIPPGLYYTTVEQSPDGYDIATVGWAANYDDPDFFLVPLLGSAGVGNNNYSRLHDPALDRQLAAASELQAPARFAAFGKLDVEIMRDLAPIVPYANQAAYFLVSKRIGCVTYNPVYYLDYAALCLQNN